MSETGRISVLSEKAVIFTVARMPDHLAQKWLQHLRDFDTANPDCHFEVMTDGAPNKSLLQMVDILRIHPGLTFQALIEIESKDVCHPSHVTRLSDASSFDEICIHCGATDRAGGGWGNLRYPCLARETHNEQ